MISLLGESINPTIPNTIIGGVFSVIVALIAVFAKDRFNKPKKKEPIDSAFHRMEKVAETLQAELDRLRPEHERIQNDNITLRIANADLKARLAKYEKV